MPRISATYRWPHAGLASRDSTHDLAGERIRDVALLVRRVVQRLELLRRGPAVAAEPDARRSVIRVNAVRPAASLSMTPRRRPGSARRRKPCFEARATGRRACGSSTSRAISASSGSTAAATGAARGTTMWQRPTRAPSPRHRTTTVAAAVVLAQEPGARRSPAHARFVTMHPHLRWVALIDPNDSSTRRRRAVPRRRRRPRG